MLRSLHRYPGLIAALLLAVLAFSGSVLAVFPATEALTAPRSGAVSVAELAGRVQARYPGVEQIKRSPSGVVTAYYFEADQPGAVVIDPATGAGVAAGEPSAFRRFVTNLHRALLLGDGGRIAAATGAGAMLLLSLSGLWLIKRRVGGWRHFLAPLKGPWAGRWHTEVARLSVAGLLLSSLTALWMAAGTFELRPEGASAPAFPAQVSETTGFPPAQIATLQDTPLAALRSLSFPAADDPTDAFTLKTATGAGFIDQGTGALLGWQEAGVWGQVNDLIYTLHTGAGAAWLGLLLAASALGSVVLSVTGAMVWLSGRRPRLRGTVGMAQAETVILVGSEGGSTWGFAATLAQALIKAGQKVHVGPMSAFGPTPRAERMILLAATYGEGEAPASAKGFLDRLAALDHAPDTPVAVLGFGDRSFPQFCGYAEAVRAAAEAKGWAMPLAFDTVDRQSPQDFARWGRALGAALGLELELNHQPKAPRTAALALVSRRDYGTEMQAPTAILRFALPRRGLLRRFPRFRAGDLLAIVPQGASLPRYYSLASASRDGFAEICVRKHPGGLCSGQLMALQPGDSVQAFLRPNPGFRPAAGAAPVILIGAGTGIGPLAGFARANRKRRPMHLYFGARHPASDLLYGEEMAEWQASGQLHTVRAAFSRTKQRHYVQDLLRRDAQQVRALVAQGAQVLVCGGRDMARGVTDALTEVLAPAGLTPAMLKAEGRYAEDVY